LLALYVRVTPVPARDDCATAGPPALVISVDGVSTMDRLLESKRLTALNRFPSSLGRVVLFEVRRT
jgi:hypothetical protein